MKRFFFRLPAALFTFFIGLSVTSVYLFFTVMPEVKAPSEEKTFIRVLAPVPDDEVEILYDWDSMKWKKRKGNFLITNRGGRAIYYLAYEKGEHFDNWVRQHGKIRMATDFVCHMGMELQELKPNESQMFEIDIPHNRQSFEAGFEFYVGDDQERTTFWVNVNKGGKYSRRTP